MKVADTGLEQSVSHFLSTFFASFGHGTEVCELV